MNDNTKRATVNVHCGIAGGVVLHLRETPPAEANLPAEVQLGYQVTLKNGFNPGIDKGFFDFWKNQNQKLQAVQQGLITAQDEEDPEAVDQGHEVVEPLTPGGAEAQPVSETDHKA